MAHLKQKTVALQRLIQPTSIAVFGGSWAHSVIEQCQQMGYAGKLWPVHPTKESVCGLTCFASIDDLPSAPDASFLGVNREISIDIVRQLSAIGAGGAVCFASGFSEAVEEDATSAGLEQALLSAAGDMPILGPNCYGFINCLDRALLWPDQHGAVAVESGVALVTQSSNIAINLSMQTRGLPIAYVFTAGNQAQVSLAQLAMTALNDKRVTAVGLHIEGFGSIRDFEALAVHANNLGKPIIALKVGKTESAQQALKSHTSSLAGSDAAADAFLNRIGITRVHSLSVFLETLKLLHISGGLSGSTLLSMSCSGGEACLIGDAAQGYGLQCPPLSDNQFQALRTALGPRVALANPLDYHTYIWNDHQSMQAMFAGMLQSDAAIAVLVLDFPRPDRCTYDSWLVAIDAFKQAGALWSGQLAVLASLPENMPESIAIQLMNDGIVPFCGLDDSLAAIAAAGTCNAKDTYVEVFLPVQNGLMDDAAIISIGEGRAKNWLREQQVLVPKNISLLLTDVPVNNADEHIANLCQSMQWPLVVKSTDSLHKSDNGGVVLGIKSHEQLKAAITAVSADSVCLIEEQIDGLVCELLVGIVSDPVHGLLMTIGAGGVHTELLADTVSGLLPLTKLSLTSMLESLRCYPLLEGYRSSAGCDLTQLLDTLMNIQQAALSIGDDLFELEINPLICTEHSAVAADAILRVSVNSVLSRS